MKAEYLTSAESGRIGRTVYFKDVGNKQVDADFVPRLNLDGTNNISFYVDEKRPSRVLSVASSSAAIVRAMTTWEGVNCSELGIYQVPSNKRVSTGLVSALLGFGGSIDYVADIVHAGWLPGAFFDMLAEDGSSYIFASTFTIVFIDAQGEPVDTNKDGKADVAWTEVYFNDAFAWADGRHYDVETVALHESGHGIKPGTLWNRFCGCGNRSDSFQSPRRYECRLFRDPNVHRRNRQRRALQHLGQLAE